MKAFLDWLDSLSLDRGGDFAVNIELLDIPPKLKILGHSYEVRLVDLNETDNYGSHNGNTNVIRLNKNKAPSQVGSTLLHEILEAINGLLELDLKHEQICGIESGLFQVLKDNALRFD